MIKTRIPADVNIDLLFEEIYSGKDIRKPYKDGEAVDIVVLELESGEREIISYEDIDFSDIISKHDKTKKTKKQQEKEDRDNKKTKVLKGIEKAKDINDLKAILTDIHSTYLE